MCSSWPPAGRAPPPPPAGSHWGSRAPSAGESQAVQSESFRSGGASGWLVARAGTAATNVSPVGPGRGAPGADALEAASWAAGRPQRSRPRRHAYGSPTASAGSPVHRRKVRPVHPATEESRRLEDRPLRGAEPRPPLRSWRPVRALRCRTLKVPKPWSSGARCRATFDRPVDASRVPAQVRRPYERHATRHAQSRGRTA